MKKKILSVVLAVLMIAVLFPMSAFAAEMPSSGECGENLTWVLSEDGTLTVSGTGEMEIYDFYENFAPWYDNDNVKSVLIEEGVTTIGEYAFNGCYSLKTVYIPSTVGHIMEGAFINCPSVEKYVVAEGNKKYYSDSQYALYELSGNTFGDEYLLYAPGAYKGEFFINARVSNLDTDQAFSQSRSITNFVVDKDNHTYKNDDKGALYNKSLGGVFMYLPRGFEGEYTVLEPTEIIPAFSVWNIDGITKITLPEGVTDIAHHAFEGSPNIREIHLPKSLRLIEGGVLNFTHSLTDIYYAGSESEWNSIIIADDVKEELERVTIHFAGSSADGDDEPETPPVEPEIVLGDANGDNKINALDATQILRFSNNKSSAIGSLEENVIFSMLDVNKDNKVNALDATQILRYANNKPSALDK